MVRPYSLESSGEAVGGLVGASPDRGAEEQEVEKQEPRAEGQGGVVAGEEVREGADPKEGPSSD